MIKKIGNIYLSILSVLLTLVIIEILFNTILPKPYVYKYHKATYRLWEEGKIFKNIDNFFKYEPNLSKRHEVFFDIKDRFIKEYSYKVNTNNFGLVQDNDIYPSIPSILFLGDSFTEGMGSGSWVNYFGGKINDFQVINGGIFGTGPQQFELLEKHIDQFYNIKKVVFLYIGSDIIRDPFNFSNQNLKCLENYESCIGNENFYGFPLNEQDPILLLEKLKKYRNVQNEKLTWKKVRRKIKNSLANLYIIRIPTEYMKIKFYNSKNEKILKNFQSIQNLINKYNQNIIFIQIETIDEILNNKKNYNSIYAENFINNLTDKHFHCRFENNPSFFYEYDGHPNKKGYKKLYNCVAEIIETVNFSN